MRELKPCPFCGWTDLTSGGDDKIVGTWCNTCEASGPNQYATGQDWNKRPIEDRYRAALEAINKIHTDKSGNMRMINLEVDKIVKEALK